MDRDVQLTLTRDALAQGRRHELYRDHATGTLERIRHGVYVSPEDAAGSTTDRYCLQVRAAMALRSAPVATGASATALMRLPLLGDAPSFVYLLSTGAFGRRRNGVIELARRGDVEVLERDGVHMTGTAFSIVQACRELGFTAALAIVENAVHVGRFGRADSLVTLNELWECYHRLLPFPGSARVRCILSYATTFADTPLETVSRLRIDELGFPAPEQQYEIWLPRLQRRAFVDFAWPEHRVVGEADGWGKYVDLDYSGGGPMERLKREKRRDDAIRALRWTPAHWDWAQAHDGAALRQILLDAGLPLVRRARVIC